MSQISKVLSFIQNTTFEDLPRNVIDYAQDCLFDTLGIAAAASKTNLSSIIRNHAARHFGAGDREKSTLMFDGRTASPVGVALAGGMSIDSLDGHDGFALAKGHIGAALVPALLSACEALGADKAAGSGQTFLTNLVIGYEIASRAGLSLHDTVSDYHTSGAWNALGCAAVTGRLLGLDDEKMRHALGIAEYHGPRSQMMRVIDHTSMLKDGSGWGAMSGSSAAFLAADGFTGAPAITVEAENVAHFWEDLGDRWCILEQNFKAYPVCRWAQPSMEAAMSVLSASGKSHNEISGIEIQTFHEATRLASPNPKDMDEAQYSIAFPVAALLVHGQVGASEIDGTNLRHPDVLRLSNMIKMSERDAFTEVFPTERFSAVRLTFADGSETLSEPHRPKGDPGVTTLSREDLIEKLYRLASPIVGEERASAILKQSLAMDKAESKLNSLSTVLTNKP